MYVAIPQFYINKFTPRRAKKSSLADVLWNLMPDNTTLSKISIQYILGRDTLLYKVYLCKGSAYEETSSTM